MKPTCTNAKCFNFKRTPRKTNLGILCKFLLISLICKCKYVKYMHMWCISNVNKRADDHFLSHKKITNPPGSILHKNGDHPSFDVSISTYMYILFTNKSPVSNSL